MSYSDLANYNVGVALRDALFEVQTLSYKIILQENFRNSILTIGDDHNIYNPQNIFFDVLKGKFDGWNKKTVSNELKNNTDLAKAAKTVIKVKGNKSRHAKKKSSRVYREVKKMYKRGYYRDYNNGTGHDKEIEKALILIHMAYREAFINVRTTLRKELYNMIPANLSINTLSGKQYKISNIYEFDVKIGKYKLNKEKISNSTDLRMLQLTIAPYIFEKVLFYKKNN